jgi:hypothetical protein
MLLKSFISWDLRGGSISCQGHFGELSRVGSGTLSLLEQERHEKGGGVKPVLHSCGSDTRSSLR